MVLTEDHKREIEERVDNKVSCIEKMYDDLEKVFILGLSGGIDSCVCAYLLDQAKVPYVLFFLNCESSAESLIWAKAVSEELKSPLVCVDLTPEYYAFCSAARFCDPEALVRYDKTEMHFLQSLKPFIKHDKQYKDVKPEMNISKMNVKARLRMIYQYYIANQYNGIVVGTENASEAYVGYATKHGDAACDVEFISDFTKTEVKHAAEYLGCPEGIINRPPSADLQTGQTDEGELGFTYDDLDNYIFNQGVCLEDTLINRKITERHKNSRHKFITTRF